VIETLRLISGTLSPVQWIRELAQSNDNLPATAGSMALFIYLFITKSLH